MIGSGNRAEKIRTYRYKDNLIVDHRISEHYNLVRYDEWKHATND